MQDESIRQIEEPVEKAKKLIGLKQSAFKDYVAARLLFLNSQLHQAAARPVAKLIDIRQSFNF